MQSQQSARRRNAGAHMVLAPCDASRPEQLWQLGATSTSGGMTTVKSLAGSKACWEINGCGYRPGSGVDTGYGCKPLPAKGVTDPCCSNMAWIVNAQSKAIMSVWNTSLCFQIRPGKAGGGELAACDGSAQQQWTLKKHSDDEARTAASYQIVSSAGKCVADISTPQANSTHHSSGSTVANEIAAARSTGIGADALVFDVKASLGWPNGARVRDLWAKKDLGTMMTIQAKLTGDGDSSMYRLSRA